MCEGCSERHTYKGKKLFFSSHRPYMHIILYICTSHLTEMAARPPTRQGTWWGQRLPRTRRGEVGGRAPAGG